MIACFEHLGKAAVDGEGSGDHLFLRGIGMAEKGIGRKAWRRQLDGQNL